MNALLELLKRQWDRLCISHMEPGRPTNPDFELEEREAVQDQKDSLITWILTWLVGSISIPLLIFVLIPEWWGRIGLYIWVAKAFLGTPKAFFLGACYDVRKYDGSRGTDYTRWWWPGGLVVAILEWAVIGIVIWGFGLPT